MAPKQLLLSALVAALVVPLAGCYQPVAYGVGPYPPVVGVQYGWGGYGGPGYGYGGGYYHGGYRYGGYGWRGGYYHGGYRHAGVYRGGYHGGHWRR